MKKLVFNDVKAKELLDIKVMRHIKGGYNIPEFQRGTCGVLISTWPIEGGLDFKYNCGISYEVAMQIKSKGVEKWCCDSCPETWYCGNGTPPSHL